MVMVNKLQCCSSRRKKGVIHHIGPLRPLAAVHYLGFQRDPEGHRKEETVGEGQQGKHEVQDFDYKAKLK